ncbi:MAG TPA: ATP phosphoribosyltransferase regulatory subunit [Hyphomicrobiales bacterium]|nr:ATP phosphoribosyltransferase regulatory subunit [Kaistiaceae bacterium]HQF30050.1 ATP phosphoribosyltransferase regulatory subunit [Hyphomicrobiales bacterium]
MTSDTLKRLIAARGSIMVDPPLLQPADVFLDLAGEDLRRRLYLTQGPDGAELCLRPDFTIPVCRIHLDGGAAGRRAEYGYVGPIFRHRASASGAVTQAGVESFGRADREAADADTLAFAIEACRAMGVADPAIRIGDSSLFVAALDALGLPAAWRARLHRLFGDRVRLDRCLARAAEDAGNGAGGPAGFLAALEGSAPEAARAVVEDLLSIARINPVGGRTAGEIAERFLEQATLAAGAGIGEKGASFLSGLLDIHGPADKAGDAIADLTASAGVDLSAAIESYRRRLAAFAANGIDVSRIEFSAEFGRRLDYYSGFVFEVEGPAGVLARGGRYDGLVAHMGAGGPVPAVGCALWIDRFEIGGAK